MFSNFHNKSSSFPNLRALDYVILITLIITDAEKKIYQYFLFFYGKKWQT